MNTIEMEKSSRTPGRRERTLYHGTSTEDANKIEREGFRPEAGHGWKEGHTYFTPNRKAAEAYADVYSDIAHDPKSGLPRDKGAILRYRPKSNRRKEVKDNMVENEMEFLETTVSGNIHPSRIKRIS